MTEQQIEEKIHKKEKEIITLKEKLLVKKLKRGASEQEVLSLRMDTDPMCWD